MAPADDSADTQFTDLVALWLADLELRELAEGTKESYRDLVRLQVLPAFGHFPLGEITTGRVEWVLKSQLIWCDLPTKAEQAQRRGRCGHRNGATAEAGLPCYVYTAGCQ